MDAYEDIRCLGRGAYAVVRLVRRKRDNRYLVAKRFLQPMAALTPKERLEVAQEIKLLSHLHHSNIIQFVDAFVDREGYQVLLMEYAPYGTLHSYLMNRNGEYLDEARIWEIFVQITLALHYIHGCNILHRDIKSPNILLAEPDGRTVKLGDFGIAQILQHSSSTSSRNPNSNHRTSALGVRSSDSHTMTHQLPSSSTIVGTPHYLSPEICQGQSYGHKSDIWSLGCVLYEVICLHRPFDASNVPAIIFQVNRNKPKPLPPGLYSNELHDLVFSLLHTSPAERPTIHDILALPKVQEHVQLWRQFVQRYRHSHSLATAPSPSVIPRSMPGTTGTPSYPYANSAGNRYDKSSVPYKSSITSPNHHFMGTSERTEQEQRHSTNPFRNKDTTSSSVPPKSISTAPFSQPSSYRPLPSDRSSVLSTSLSFSHPVLSVHSNGNQSRWTGPVSVVSSFTSSPSSSDRTPDISSYTPKHPSTIHSLSDPEMRYLQVIEQAFLDPVPTAPTLPPSAPSISSTTILDNDPSLSIPPSIVSDAKSTASTASTRSILRDRLLTIENKFLNATPAPSGRVWEALGASWGELGNFGNAVRCYRYALRAKSIIAPLDAVEQLGNLLVRYGHQLYRKVTALFHPSVRSSPSRKRTILARIEHLAKEALMGVSLNLLDNCPPMMVIPVSPTASVSLSPQPSSPLSSVPSSTVFPTSSSLPPVWKILVQALIEEGIAYLERACSLGNTAERRALLGSALRQRAWMGLTPYSAALLPVTTVPLPDYPPPLVERKIILENGQTVVSKLPSVPSVTGDLKRAAQAYGIAHELEVEERIAKYSTETTKPLRSSALSAGRNSLGRRRRLPVNADDNDGDEITATSFPRDHDFVYSPQHDLFSVGLSVSENRYSSPPSHRTFADENHAHRHPSYPSNGSGEGNGNGGIGTEGKGWKSIFHQPPYARLNQLSLEILARGTDADARHPSSYIEACREAETWALESTEADPTDMWRWLLVVDARRLRFMVGDTTITEASIVHDYQEQLAFGVSTRMKSNVLNELQFELDVIHFRHQEALAIERHMDERVSSHHYHRDGQHPPATGGDASPEELHTVRMDHEIAIRNHLQGLIKWFTTMEAHLGSLLRQLREKGTDDVPLPLVDQDMEHIYKEKRTTYGDSTMVTKEPTKETKDSPVVSSGATETERKPIPATVAAVTVTPTVTVSPRKDTPSVLPITDTKRKPSPLSIIPRNSTVNTGSSPALIGSAFPVLEPIIEEDGSTSTKRKVLERNGTTTTSTTTTGGTESTYSPSFESIISDEFSRSSRQGFTVPPEGTESVSPVKTTGMPKVPSIMKLASLPSVAASPSPRARTGSSPRSTTPQLFLSGAKDSPRAIHASTFTANNSSSSGTKQNPFARSTPKESKFIPLNRSRKNLLLHPVNSSLALVTGIQDDKKKEEENDTVSKDTGNTVVGFPVEEGKTKDQMGQDEQDETADTVSASERPHLATISTENDLLSSTATSFQEPSLLYRTSSLSSPSTVPSSAAVEPAAVDRIPITEVNEPSLPLLPTTASTPTIEPLASSVPVSTIISSREPVTLSSPSSSIVPQNKCIHCTIM